MLNEIEKDFQTKKENEFLKLFLDSQDDVRLSDDEKLMLLEHPKMLHNLWKQTQQAILLHSFPSILSAQIEKAKNGDTTSTKFLSEFIAPSDEDDSTNRTTEYARWESLAIQLRDNLHLEYSAQDIVIYILEALIAAPEDAVRTLLNLDSD